MSTFPSYSQATIRLVIPSIGKSYSESTASFKARTSCFCAPLFIAGISSNGCTAWAENVLRRFDHVPKTSNFTSRQCGTLSDQTTFPVVGLIGHHKSRTTKTFGRFCPPALIRFSDILLINLLISFRLLIVDFQQINGKING